MVKYQTIVHSPALIIKINFAQGFLVFEGVLLTIAPINVKSPKASSYKKWNK